MVSVGRFAGRVVRSGRVLGLFLQQTVKFGAGLINQGGGELLGRRLTLGGQILDAHG